MNNRHSRIFFVAVIFSAVLFPMACPLFAQDDSDGKALASSAVQALASAQREIDAAVGEYNAAVERQEQESEAFEANMNDQGDPRVMIQLTYPVGKSPKVFTKGWVFGAEALFNPDPSNDDAEPEDLSGEVKWEGSGTFNPGKGKRSRPVFSGEGDNTIILSVAIEGKKITKTFHVNAVFPARYARIGSLAKCDADVHSCMACPHPVIGPVQTGSLLVSIDGKPAARVGDTGVHMSCCGPNTFTIITGDPEVLIDGRPAAKTDPVQGQTKHCGGVGSLIPA